MDTLWPAEDGLYSSFLLMTFLPMLLSLSSFLVKSFVSVSYSMEYLLSLEVYLYHPASIRQGLRIRDSTKRNGYEFNMQFETMKQFTIVFCRTNYYIGVTKGISFFVQ